MIFRFLTLAALLLVSGELRAKPLPEIAGFAPKLTIYLAKGPANSCGPGCDRWIAVEGNVDQEAASRVRRFLRDVKDTKRPIYLHSPGGTVGQALMIGRLLRNRKAVARVGRTIVAACGADAQIDEACLKIKTGGGEVEAEVATSRAMCNSACGYLFLGATTREVAPDAAMAVHNSRFTLVYHGHPSARQIADFTEKGEARADRERASFVAAMGISRELIDLIRTVKFENPHMLTRPELFRFGIDTRTVVETAWTTQTAVPAYIRKVALAKRDDDGSFRTMEWRLSCETKNRARLTFMREYDKNAASQNSVFLMAGDDMPVTFEKFLARFGPYEAWSGRIGSDAIKTLVSASRLQMGEDILTSEGKPHQKLFDIGTGGLESAWAGLYASCPDGLKNVKPTTASHDPTPAPAK